MSVIVGVCPWALMGLVLIRGAGIIKRSQMLRDIGVHSYHTLVSFHKETDNTEALKSLVSQIDY